MVIREMNKSFCHEDRKLLKYPFKNEHIKLNVMIFLRMLSPQINNRVFVNEIKGLSILITET